MRQSIARLAELWIALHCIVEHDECALVVVACHVDGGESQAWLDAVRTEVDRLVKGVDRLLSINVGTVELFCLIEQSGFVGVESIVQGVAVDLAREAGE